MTEDALSARELGQVRILKGGQMAGLCKSIAVNSVLRGQHG